MKKINFLCFLFFCFSIITSNIIAQSIKINVMGDPNNMPPIDFGNFAFTNNLQGAQRIFYIELTPQNEDVIIEGKFYSKDFYSQNNQEIFSFKTNTFKSKNFYNSDIGLGDLQINEVTTNSSALDELIKKGKPSGELNIMLNANFINLNQSVSDNITLKFLNPSQTITILNPIADNSYDVNNVIAQWTLVTGAVDYKIKANVRKNLTQSFEEALNLGTPIINNKSVGNVSSINLRTILDREWNEGDEIVLQVAAVIPNTFGNTELFSPIVNFYLNKSNNSEQNFSNNLLSQFLTFNNFGLSNDLISKILNGEIQIIDIEDEIGNKITFQQLQQLLNYLSSHPQDVINVNFLQK
ncbi:MAG: hypothetical protein STSR0008_11130 [Ignavibacterium sp.]